MSTKIIQIIFISLFLFISCRKTLFDETYIKYLKLKNRIFRASVGDSSFKDGKIAEQGYKLYDELSKNEVGTIFTGYTTVSDYNKLPNINVFRIDKDEYISEFKKLVDIVHKNGANFFMQLVHIGLLTSTKVDTVYAPSVLPLQNNPNKLSKEMTKEDILRIENDFAEAALRAKTAGFDGVEIHAAHFYLVSQFLSPITNRRTDEYGGSDENRARFLLEIIKKVREKVGNDYIVGIKINSEDGNKNGITEEGFIKICFMAEEAGIDFIQVSGMKWVKETIKTPIYADISSKLAEKVKIPIIVTGGARNVDELNEILNKSNIQYFGMARPFICEYDLIKKWKNGETKKAKCISCNSCFYKQKGICVFNKNQCNIKLAEPAEFQSIKLGEYKVTYLPDGYGYNIPLYSYHGSTEEDWKHLEEYLNNEGRSLISYGSFLIEYKNEKILFDLGIGKKHISFPEGYGDGGELLNNLKKAGLDRKDITKVIYSHFHPDTTGWTSFDENGKIVLTFPNADYYSSKNEWEFWMNKIGDPMGVDVKNFKEPLEEIIKFLEDGQEIIPNLFVKFEFGHTPGLVNLILEENNKKIWFISDMVHSDLQFVNPYWSFFTDNNQEKAIKIRINTLDSLSESNTIIANSHFINEAFGYVKKVGEGKYEFERYSK